MDAWTELTQAAIRDRIQEREIEAAGERLASISRSAAIVAAAIRTIVDAGRPAWTEPVRIEVVASEGAADCADCPTAIGTAA